MNEKIDKNHDEVMGAVSEIKEFLKLMPANFATKQEHQYNSERIKKVEATFSRLTWMLVTGVLGLAGGALFVVIMLFGDKF